MPKSNSKPLEKYGVREAYQHYQQAAILLTKIGFSPREVWAMSPLEVGSWVRQYLESIGAKSKDGLIRFDPHSVIVSQRRVKSTSQQGA